MPNWCQNSMKITGAAEEIARFKQTCIVNGDLDFGTIIPMPEEVRDSKEVRESGLPVWYKWESANWGTYGTRDFEFGTDEPNCLEFFTPWSPPIPIYKKLGEMFPTLLFELHAFELNVELNVRGTIKGDKIEWHDVPTSWTLFDPKTGKTISGSGPVDLDDINQQLKQIGEN
jgi:hypothetical protein